MRKAEVLLSIEDDRGDGSLIIRIPDAKRYQRFHVGPESDISLGQFVRGVVIGLAERRMKDAAKRSRAQKAKGPTLIASDGTKEGHLSRIADAIRKDARVALKTYPQEEIDEAQKFL